MKDDHVVINSDTTVQTITSPHSEPRPKVKITVYSRWCKGCGICAAFCPTHAIKADPDGRPTQIHAERCIACQACVIRCPDMAITIEPLIEEDE